MKPNWKNSILNVSCTLSDFLGNKNEIPKISILSDYLKKGYENVVFICLDGLGMYPLTRNLKRNDFLRKNVKKTITSVFPATTTNATTTLNSADYPSNHGMFGWSLYIPHLDRCVNVFTGTDSMTEENIGKACYEKLFEYEYFFDKTDGEYTANAVFPPYANKAKNNYVFKNNDEMFLQIEKVLSKSGKQFVFCYNNEPDSTMHVHGVNSIEAKEIITYFNKKIEELAKKHSDTLIILTCDHGHIDITDYIMLYKDNDLLATLATPPYLEARAVAFRVKKDREKDFLKEIKKYKELKLFTTDYLIEKNYFGPTKTKTELLGDYIAVVKNTHTQVLISENMPVFKGHHTAFSRKEMILPLIIIEGNK